MNHKLCSKSGESLVEILVALLIMTLAMMVLATGIDTAQSVKNKMKETESDSTAVVEVSLDDYSLNSYTLYGENGYYYYERK